VLSHAILNVARLKIGLTEENGVCILVDFHRQMTNCED